MKRIFALIIVSLLYTTQLKAVDFYISSTVNSPTSGCVLSNSESVQIYIGNAGGITTANTTFDISYTVNGNTVTESYTVNAGWAPSATFSYTFSTNADLSACQEHIFEFELDLPGDTNPANNMVTASIFSDCAPTLGTITGPTTVCEGINSDDLVLGGYNGIINKWESTTDGGATWTSIANTTDTESFTNLTLQSDYRVILESLYGFCPNDTTSNFTVYLDALSDGGTLNSNQNICSNGNNGLLNVDGFVGDILDWQFSIDGGISWNTLNHTNDTLEFTDQFTTIQYQVTVQNGTCPAALSSLAELTVIAGSDAGYITGEDTVCNAEADSLLSLSTYYGNIQSWIYSTDSGATWTNTNENNPSFSYAALLGYTIFGTVVQEGSCPNDTAFHPIIVLPTSVSGGPNLTIIEGDSVQLQGSGGVSYVWTPSSYIDNDLSQTPIVWPPTDMTYSVEVTDIYNCKDTAFVLITVNPNLEVITIPNLMTPNGDGYNDIWKIKNIEAYEESEVTVFDAYGKVIYQNSPYLNDWGATTGTGDVIPDGTYFYVVILGEDFDPIKGALTIVSKN